MSTQPEPTPGESDAPLERREEEDAMRGPGHEDPDALREDVGLDDEPEAADEGRDGLARR